MGCDHATTDKQKLNKHYKQNRLVSVGGHPRCSKAAACPHDLCRGNPPPELVETVAGTADPAPAPVDDGPGNTSGGGGTMLTILVSFHSQPVRRLLINHDFVIVGLSQTEAVSGLFPTMGNVSGGNREVD